MRRMLVTHRTGYSYAAGAAASFNEIRMTPLSSLEQQVISSVIEITPTAWQHTYVDYWGTHVVAFEVHEAHHQLSITARSEVDIRRPLEDRADVLTWDDLADPALCDSFAEWLETTAYTGTDDNFDSAVDGVRAGASTPAGYARACASMLHTKVSYQPGATGVHTSAEEAWRARSGVCQDISHLLIAALRRAGVPARYVSGYLLPDPDAEIGVPQKAESHAWTEFWDGAWIGVDVTNDTRPDERYIEVGRGRDYADVAPLTGIYSSRGPSDMFVEVELTRVR